MQKKYLLILLGLLATSPNAFTQEDTIALETTVIKGNTELPKILYVVPWQDITGKTKTEQKLTLHSLFGDIYDPVAPQAPVLEASPDQ